MKIKRFWNTKKRGIVEFLFYKEKEGWIGVCLTFNILEEGKDLNKLTESVEEAARLHLKVVRKKNLPDKLLNRYASEKYWKKYFESQKLVKEQKSRKKDIPATFQLPYRLLDTALAV